MISAMLHRLIDRITPRVEPYDPESDEFVQFLREHYEASEKEVKRISAASPDSFLDGVLLPDFPPRGRKRGPS